VAVCEDAPCCVCYRRDSTQILGTRAKSKVVILGSKGEEEERFGTILPSDDLHSLCPIPTLSLVLEVFRS